MMMMMMKRPHGRALLCCLVIFLQGCILQGVLGACSLWNPGDCLVPISEEALDSVPKKCKGLRKDVEDYILKLVREDRRSINTAEEVGRVVEEVGRVVEEVGRGR
jgi:hypothetical protein